MSVSSALFWRRQAATSAWQQGTSTMAWAFFCRPKAMASSVAVSQACSAVSRWMRSRQPGAGDGRVQELHPRVAQPPGALTAALDEVLSRFY